MKNKTILITGGAGFIGSMTNLLLQEEGFSTVVLDNLSTGNKSSVLSGKLIVGDISDRPLLDNIFHEHKISAVMHFAAKTDVGESVRDPALYYRQNVVNTLNLLDAMRDAEVSKFIFSSTAAVYGLPTSDEVIESSPCNPINPYGESKLLIEKVLKDYSNAYGLQACSLRYFNAAGGDPDNRIHYNGKKQGNLIPIILDCIQNDRPVTVHGTDYPTRDGTCIRDYIHIADLGSAHILALKKLLNSNASLCYNLGNKQGFSVLEVIRAAEEVTGKTIDVIMGPRRPGDPPQLIANAEKAKNELGWKPLYPEIKKMVEDAWIARQK